MRPGRGGRVRRVSELNGPLGKRLQRKGVGRETGRIPSRIRRQVGYRLDLRTTPQYLGNLVGSSA